jgi:hypothetical protein
VAVNAALWPDATGPAAMSSENSLPRSNPYDPAAGPGGTIYPKVLKVYCQFLPPLPIPPKRLAKPM